MVEVGYLDEDCGKQLMQRRIYFLDPKSRPGFRVVGRGHVVWMWTVYRPFAFSMRHQK